MSKTLLVRFDYNKYSVHTKAAGRPVEVHAYADGDRQMVGTLAAVTTDGLDAVEAACAEALAGGAVSRDVVLNVLTRQRQTAAPTASPRPRLCGSPASPPPCAGSGSLHRATTSPTWLRDAIARTITTLPRELRRSLTWDQGAEMAQHARLKVDTGVQVYFCDPQSPWQRGSNENTNGLLRQYFPKGADLSAHSADAIAAVAATLNARPRKTLGWKTPAEALDQCLAEINKHHVATTD